ncbi:LysR substrate-binding domain-containing protein [Enteractinococcus helveticum]|uniref:LysR substrate-binding domain-containing protein n=1 Tax=Enteractinococcus helveticum TaxID=1837282 RepID=UPI000A5FC2A0|nr:LysR substrate-binding domain-containing protein [Enteractinococcus helveticum]
MVVVLEVKQAEAFLAVAVELHFGRAAGRLRIAQPPLSRMIKQLERQLGVELFIRSTRSVELTAIGQALLDPARKLVAASQEAVETVLHVSAGKIGRVRIGFAGASTYQTVGDISRQLRSQHPGLTLDVHSAMFSPNALQHVLDQELELAIGRWDFLPPELDSLILAQEEVIVALPPNHRFADNESIAMRDLADENWISLPIDSGSALHNRLIHLAFVAGFTPRITQTAPDSWAQLVLVEVQSGCAITLNSVRRHLPDLGVRFKTIADSPNPPLDVRLIWRKDNLTPPVQAAIDVARELFPEPEQN